MTYCIPGWLICADSDPSRYWLYSVYNNFVDQPLYVSLCWLSFVLVVNWAGIKMLWVGGETSPASVQLHRVPTYHTVPAQLVYQHGFPGHQCSTFHVLHRNVFWSVSALMWASNTGMPVYRIPGYWPKWHRYRYQCCAIQYRSFLVSAILEVISVCNAVLHCTICDLLFSRWL